MKTPIIERPEYTVFLEQTRGLSILHGDVHALWTRGVKFRLRQDLDAVAETLGPVFAVHYPDQGIKHIKFVKMMGFAPFNATLDGRGRPCVLFKKENNNG